MQKNVYPSNAKIGETLTSDSDKSITKGDHLFISTGGPAKLDETEVRCGCLKWVRVQVFGSGLSGVISFRCVRDSTVLALSVYDKGIERVLGSYPSKAWTAEQFTKVESELAPCSCGGAFIHDALPKCPFCGSVLRLGGLNPDEVIVLKGRMVDSEKQKVWKTPEV